MEGITQIKTNKKQSRCLFRCKYEIGMADHRFPLSNKTLMEKWVKAIGGKEKLINNPYLCSKHFDKKYLVMRRGKYQLIRPAIPTIFPHNNLPNKKRIPKQLNVDNSKPNENETCRACFTTKSDKFQSLWDSKKLLDLFEKCSYLKVKKNDGLPSTLCSCCVLKCFSWFNFFELCSQTEAIFKTMNKNKEPSAGGGSNNTNTLPEWKQQIPINNANKSPICISDDEEYENYIIYKDTSSDSDNSNFKDDDDFIVDKRSADKGPRKKTISCNRCGEIFNNKILLNYHIDEDCPRNNQHNKKKPFKCDICDRTFNKNSHLFEHKQQHNEGKQAASVESSLIPGQISTVPVGTLTTTAQISSAPTETAGPVETPTASAKTSTQLDTSENLDETYAVEVGKSGCLANISGDSIETSVASIETSAALILT